MSAHAEEQRLLRAKRSLNKVKHPESSWHAPLGNFGGKNGRTFLMSHVMHAMFPAFVMVLGVVSRRRHVVPTDFSQQGLRLNIGGYTDMLEKL